MLVNVGIAIISGFFGALLKDHVVRPLRNYRQIRKKIAKDLIKYSHLITSPGSGQQDMMDEARYELRDDAAELRSVIEDIPAYSFWSKFWIPGPKILERVEGRLIRLSNSIHNGNATRNHEDREKVRDLLKFDSK